jgi:hypothetical protein
MLLKQRPSYPLRRKRHLAQAYACRVEDRIRNGGRINLAPTCLPQIRNGDFE